MPRDADWWALPDLTTRVAAGAIAHRRRLSAPGALLGAATSLFALLIALPIVAIFARVLPVEAIGRPVVLEALRLSGLTTLAALALALALGTPVAYLLARRNFPGRALLDSLVELPMALPALLGGAVMCWARALGEFGATIRFAGSFQGRTQTMPLAIYDALESDLDAALALSAILAMTSFVALALLRLAVRRATDA